VATGTTSDPPKRVWEDRRHVDFVTQQEWLQPWLFLYNGGLLVSSLMEGFPECQWHARVRFCVWVCGCMDWVCSFILFCSVILFCSREEIGPEV
jgi:hypothetical protein